MMSIMDFDHKKFYRGEYSNSTYGKKWNNIFERIINLPKSKSDNEKRFNYFKKKSGIIFGKNYKPKLLDVGSGIGVFPWRAKNEGWDIIALDPDKNHSDHIKRKVNIECVNDRFFEL